MADSKPTAATPGAASPAPVTAPPTSPAPAPAAHGSGLFFAGSHGAEGTAPEAASPFSTELGTYQPLSLLAIAGLILGIVYGVLVVLMTGYGMVKGEPIFLDGWVILIAVGGAVLALLGLLHIRQSEGIITGRKIAWWGLWVSVVPGLGYTAYTYFTGLALKIEANNFLEEISATDPDNTGFFPRCQEGTPEQLNRAFLLTMHFTRRFGHDPRNARGELEKTFDLPGSQSREGELTRFRHHPLTRLLIAGGKDIKIEPLGVQQWHYEKGGYRIYRNYRITTAEVVFDMLLIVASFEGAESQGKRKWQVDLFAPQGMNFSQRLTPFGERMKILRGRALAVLDQWLEKAHDKTAAPLKDLTRYDKAFAADPPKLLKEKINNPEFLVKHLEARSGEDMPCPWEKIDGGRLRLSLEQQLTLMPGKDLAFFLRARVFFHLETTAPFDPHGDLPATPQWRIAGFEIAQAFLVEPKMKMNQMFNR